MFFGKAGDDYVQIKGFSTSARCRERAFIDVPLDQLILGVADRSSTRNKVGTIITNRHGERYKNKRIAFEIHP